MSLTTTLICANNPEHKATFDGPVIGNWLMVEALVLGRQVYLCGMDCLGWWAQHQEAWRRHIERERITGQMGTRPMGRT